MKDSARPSGIRFAERTGWPLAENRLSFLRQKLSGGKTPVLDLSESNPSRAGLGGLVGAADWKKLAGPAGRRYEPSAAGLFAARRAVARDYAAKGTPLDPERIFLTASTSESYSHLFRLLADAGDAVAVPRPSYPLFEYLAALNDVRTVPYPLRYDGQWHLDFAGLRKACEDKSVKAVILVNPNNPTGSFLKRDEWERLKSLLRERGLALISDEVFSDYVLRAADTCVRTVAGNRECLTFVLGGISKALALPQMKLGWIAASGPGPELEAAVSRLAVILDTYLSVNGPVQAALPSWLKKRKSIQSAVCARLRANLAALEKALVGHPACELLNAEGGWYAVLRLPETKPEEEWALEFLSRERVYVQPGYFFDFERGAHVIVSLLVPEKKFRGGIQRVLERVEKSIGGN